MSDTSNFISIINKLIDTEFANKAEASGMLVRKLVTVASYDEATNTATVFFQGDTEVESLAYPNATNRLLKKGDKVYLFHSYGNPAKGWIMYNSSGSVAVSGLTYDVIKEL